MRLAVIILATSCYGAQADKTVLVLGAHAGDAERLGGQQAGYRTVYTALIGGGLDLRIDLTTATRRPQAQSEVSKFLLAHNPEITITHSMGEADIEHHSAADLVYRAWQDARRKGARLGQLWFRVPGGTSGMIQEPSFRRFFDRARRGDYYVVADAQSAAPQEAPIRPAPPPAYRPRPGRQPVVMAIGAHADDVEHSFGGTFAKLIQSGWKGIYVSATNNTAGNQLDVYNPSRPGGYLSIQKAAGPFPADALETIQIRQEEARRAAAVFGAEPVFLDLNETFCWIGRSQVYMDDSRWSPYNAPGNGIITAAPAGKGLDLATDLMKKHEPDVVLAMLLGDRNPEHGQTGDLAYRAFVRAAREGARVGQLWMTLADRPQYLECVRLEPDISVDVTEQVPLNQKALALHVSQNGGNPPLRHTSIEGRYYEHFLLVPAPAAGPGYGLVRQWGELGSKPGQFRFPAMLAVDRQSNVYVVDQHNHRVQKFDVEGRFLLAWGEQGSGPRQFQYPFGIAIDSRGDVYVSDMNNHRVQKFTSRGEFRAIAADGFKYPYGLAIDRNDVVYVVDTLNYRVRKFDRDLHSLGAWGDAESIGVKVYMPHEIAILSDGNVVLTDRQNHRVSVFTPDGKLVRRFGEYGDGPGRFSEPHGVAVTPDGALVICDRYNFRIQRFHPEGRFEASWKTDGTGDDTRHYPLGIASDHDGNIYVTDHYQHCVQKYRRPGGGSGSE